jgi:uncharacterized membrane protein YccF (DUF307 family)
MRTIGNVIWLLCGGLVMGLGWWLIGLIAFVIIGIPFGIQHLKLAKLALAPIGKTIIDSDYAQAVRAGSL